MKCSYEQEKSSLEAGFQKIEKNVDNLILISQCVTNTIDILRNEMVSRFEKLATQAICNVFARDDYQLVINTKNTKFGLEVDFSLISEFHGKKKKVNVKHGHGGGVQDILSFIFRVLIVALSGMPRILILDEPFKFAHLGVKQIGALGQFIRRISEELDFQLIIVTSNSNLLQFADSSFIFSLDSNNETQVEVNG
jgi:hypothetical protein